MTFDRAAISGYASARVASLVVIGVVAAWLFAAAVLVQIEYYDGLSAISNARYFLGLSTFYFFDRGPLMAWVQMPSEALKSWLSLHPLDVRAHHAAMALVHLAYVVVVFRALTGQFGHSWSTLIAFLTGITSYVFFSYAPFLSHDLAPGALLIWMLIWSEVLFTPASTRDLGAPGGARHAGPACEADVWSALDCRACGPRAAYSPANAAAAPNLHASADVACHWSGDQRASHLDRLRHRSEQLGAGDESLAASVCEPSVSGADLRRHRRAISVVDLHQELLGATDA